MAEKLVHVEVLGRDGAALQRFYGQLFGWDVDTNNPGGYGMVSAEQAGITVGVGATPDGSEGHTAFYASVADIDAMLNRAEELGGKVLMPKTSPGPGVTIALFADPAGHVVGLTQA
jgi:uncharacterized protein